VVLQLAQLLLATVTNDGTPPVIRVNTCAQIDSLCHGKVVEDSAQSC
jgi:hypothetical protein